MSVGLKIVAAAANNRPINIKKLVETALFERAQEVITEGVKIASEQIYGLNESIKPIGSGTVSKTSKTLTMKTTDSSGKTTTKKKSIKEDELDEGRSRERNLKGKSYEVDGKRIGGKEVSGINRKVRKAWKQMGTKGAGPPSTKATYYRNKSRERAGE